MYKGRTSFRKSSTVIQFVYRQRPGSRDGTDDLFLPTAAAIDAHDVARHKNELADARTPTLLGQNISPCKRCVSFTFAAGKVFRLELVYLLDLIDAALADRLWPVCPVGGGCVRFYQAGGHPCSRLSRSSEGSTSG
jgi:hypothetical protein